MIEPCGDRANKANHGGTSARDSRVRAAARLHVPPTSGGSARCSAHVTAVGARWLDGAFWFQTGAGTRKGRNVARDPRCSIAVSVRGADVVVEGDATRVTDPGALARIAKAWADRGWPAEPDDSGPGITAPFNAPSQGPPPWNVYRIEPRSAIVTLTTEPGGLTRFRF